MTPEQSIQREILREFGTRSDMRLWRAAVGAALTPGGRLCRFGVRGQADLSGILGPAFGNRAGARVEIEVKTPTGVLRPEQRAFGAMITRFGGLYIVARSVADVAEQLGAFLEGGGK